MLIFHSYVSLPEGTSYICYSEVVSESEECLAGTRNRTRHELRAVVDLGISWIHGNVHGKCMCF